MTKRLINDKIEPVNDKVNRGDLMIDKEKANARYKRYQDKCYTRLNIMLHNETDAELVKYLQDQKKQGKSPSQVLRDLYKAVMK